MGKYGKYKKRYNPDWEKEECFKAWLTRGDSSEHGEAFCKLCRKYLRAHKNDLLKHKNTDTHSKREGALKTTTQLQLPYKSNVPNEEKRFDIILAVYIANYCSIKSIDHLGEILNLNFVGTSEKPHLRMHRTKCSKIILNIINPGIIDQLTTEIGDKLFSIILDKSTDVGRIKYLAYCICYFNTNMESVCTDFLGLQEIDNSSAENLVQYFRNFMAEFHLNLKNLIALATDGANSLCDKNNSLFAALKRELPHLQLLRCVCHSLNLCAMKSADELPSSLEFLLRETRNWFSYSTQRIKSYENLYCALNNGKPPLKLTQLSATRWLAYYNAIKTNLDQWEELKTLFTTISQEADKINNCFLARTLAKMYEDNSNILYLVFLKTVLKDVNDLNLVFQSDVSNVNIFRAHDELRLLILSLSRRVFKPSYLNWNDNASNSEQFTYISQAIHKSTDVIGNSVLTLESIDFGQDFEIYIANYPCTLEQLKVVKERCRNFLIRLIKEMCERLPGNFNLIQKLQLFSPEVCLQPVNKISAKELPWEMVEHMNFDRDAIENQWLKLQCLKFNEIVLNVNDYINPNQIHAVQFWVAVSNMKTAW